MSTLLIRIVCVATALVLAGFGDRRYMEASDGTPAGPLQRRTAGQNTRYPVVDESTIARTLHFATGGDRTLDVRAINGSIHVSSGDGGDVQLDVRKSVRAESDNDLYEAQRAVRLDIVERTTRIEAIVRDSRGEVCGEPSDGNRDWQRRRYEVTFDFTIRVPAGTGLRLCTINGGDVLVEGTDGDFEVDNVNGRITMENIRGSGDARTVNGPLKISFAENPRAPSVFTTVNGNVMATFQDGLSADLKMKTFNGGLFTDFDVQPLAQASGTSAERRNGRVVYRSNTFTMVRVGSGGPEMTFETLNGDVRVLRAPR
jgi:hypothetical protein